MNETESFDNLFSALREASRGADRKLTAELVTAASEEDPGNSLTAVAVSALERGVDRADLIRACEAARLEILVRAGAVRDYEDPTEDHVLNLMDRLSGWGPSQLPGKGVDPGA